MKKILLFISLFSLITYAQAQEKPLEFSEVVQEENHSAKELYTTLRAWVAENFKSANQVIQMDDKENGVLICKGNFSYRAPGGMTYRYIDGHVNFILKAQARDGRYKITLSDFVHSSEDARHSSTWSFGLITNREKFKTRGLQDKRWLKTWPDLQKKCTSFSEEIINSIKTATSDVNPIIDKEDEW